MIQAVGDRLIVEPFKVSETSSGIVRIDQGHSTPVKGTVVSVGPASKYHEGDVVYFRRYSVDELKIPQADGGEKSVFVVEDADIVAIETQKQNALQKTKSFFRALQGRR